jgi:methionyl aminopeptidase
MFINDNKIHYKQKYEIELMKQSGDLLGRVHGEISRNIKSGVSTKYLDDLAYTMIRDHGALPSFLNYNGFPYTLCISVNDTVVHGFPSKYELKDGDIVSVDCGVFLNGYHADSAYTYRVGELKKEVSDLLKDTYDSLYQGISQAKAGNRIGDISYAIQSYTEKRKYGVVRELVGHGVGKKLHEKPEVPNFGKKGSGTKLLNGMVLAIEPMINLGKKEVYQLDDNWTIKTKDGLPSAHFEHTVAINDGNPIILTTFDYIIKEQRIDG